MASSFSTPFAKAIPLLAAAVLCQALAGRTMLAMSASEPWWLAHAASLTIRAYGTDIVNRVEIAGDFRAVLHLAVIGVAWALDRVFTVFYAND
jgi:hypothetical protein